MNLVEIIVFEWTNNLRIRDQKNFYGHPFEKRTSESMKVDALKFYNKCIDHDFTKLGNTLYEFYFVWLIIFAFWL